ncbi:MAG: DUF924 family protein [Marivibrio sp.]|uniref:DUF924 family protein n=1 Tax=Marivibrio sp. TaxID=2039719 RepID=UPI0032F04247
MDESDEAAATDAAQSSQEGGDQTVERPVGSDVGTLGVEGPDDDAQSVLDFWFGELTPRQWFAKDDRVDAAIAERFATLTARVATGAMPHWAGSPGGLLAAVIVLDQFPRNLYRDDPRAYATDDQARALADEAIERGLDRGMSARARQFLYMPFMHSEAPEDQARCVDLFATLEDPDALWFAERHKEIVDRFGRFPHRNKVLGRETTAEEAAFLKEPNSAF